jgi:hypothetical protein
VPRKGNVYAEAEKEKTRLHDAITGFQKATQVTTKKSQRVDVDEEPSHQDWPDVMQAMHNAQQTYQKRHDGKPSARIQRLCASVGNSGATFQAWLTLLPDGDYTSVVCGAFKLVISVSTAVFKDLWYSKFNLSSRQYVRAPCAT